MPAPNWKQIIGRQLAPLHLPPARELEIIEELALHFEAAYEEARAAGLSDAEAEAQARQNYDWQLLECELSRTERTPARQQPLELRRGGMRMESLWQDLRFGVRMLWKQPGFTFVAVLTLALGIGASTAVFSVVDGWLLRPLPFQQPERLIAVWEAETQTPHLPSVFAAYRHYTAWRQQAQTLESLAGYFWRPFTWTGSDGAETLMGQIVTPEFFPTLGLAPLHGRTFRAEDLQEPPVAVLGYGFWQRQMGGALDALGKTITLNGKTYTVIGIAPPGHSLPSVAQPDRAEDVWILAKPDEPLVHGTSYGEEPENPIGVVARLKPGVTAAQARAELEAIKARSDEQKASGYKRFTTFVAPLQQDATRSVRPTLLTMAGAVVFVWLIVCANVAGLMLARVAERRKELAIRSALGAGRWRIVRQTLTESLLLASFGSVCGVLLAQFMLRGLLALEPFDIPAFHVIAINYRVLLFVVLLACATAVAFGLVPAWQAARLRINELIKESGRGNSSSKGTRRVRNVLVVAEVALSLMLLVGAGLMTRSLARLATEPLGYSTNQVLTAIVSLPAKSYPKAPQRIQFYDRWLARVRALPGVQLAGASTLIPVYSGSGNEFMIEGQPPVQPDALPVASDAQISEDYFAAVGTALRAGRAFAATDNEQSEPVAVINETLARRYFPNADAIGKRLRRGDAKSKSPWRTIVGIVGDTKGIAYGNLGWRTEAMMYEPLRQATDNGLARGLSLFIRLGEKAPLTAAMFRAELRAVDPNLPAPELTPMETFIARQLRQPRLQTLLAGSLAVLALVLAALGLYGVMSYAVIQRTPEIGLRMALGAGRRDVLRLVLGQGLKLFGLGALLGLAGALGLTRWLASLLYGISATDPFTFVGITLLLMLVALLACWRPARRATKVDPLLALRHE